MAFRWSAADGQTLNADLAALTYNFVIFQCLCVYICVCVWCAGVRTPYHPFWIPACEPYLAGNIDEMFSRGS